MPALPILTEDALDDGQRAVWDIVTNGRRGGTMRLVGDSGGLLGPFNAMLHAPEVGQHVVATGEALRFHSSLPTRLIEVVTVTVAAHWRSEFEWAVHADLAARCGVTDDALAAIAWGETPDVADPSEAVAIAVALDLLRDGRPSPEHGAEAFELLGPRGLVELVNLVGYYCTIAFVLATFDVELPEGATPVWGERPQA